MQLKKALWNADITQVEDLIREGADINWDKGVWDGDMTPLGHALRIAQENTKNPDKLTKITEIIRILLHHKADPNKKFPWPLLGGTEFITPLHFTVYAHFDQLTKLLLEYGADIHQRHRTLGRPMTVLAYAKKYNPEFVPLLLQRPTLSSATPVVPTITIAECLDSSQKE